MTTTVQKGTRPGVTDRHVDRSLTDYSVWVSNDSMDLQTYSRILPKYNSDHKSNEYFVYNKGDLLRNQVQKAAPGAYAPVADFGLETDDYVCKRYHVSAEVTAEDLANQDQAIDARQDNTMFVTEQLMQHKAGLISNVIFNTANFKSSHVKTLNANEKWSNPTGSGSNPIKHIEDALDRIRRSTGSFPDSMAAGYDALRALKNHPNLIARVDQTSSPANPAETINASIGRLWGLVDVFDLRSIENTGKKGAADNLDSITKDDVLIYHRGSDMASLRSKTFCKVFNWQRLVGASDDGILIYRVEDARGRCEYVIGESAFDIKIVEQDLGYLLKDVV